MFGDIFLEVMDRHQQAIDKIASGPLECIIILGLLAL